MSTAASEKPCRWCRVFQKNLDLFSEDLPLLEPKNRPKMHDLMEKMEIYSWKKENTFNFPYRLNSFFTFRWNLSCSSTSSSETGNR